MFYFDFFFFFAVTAAEPPPPPPAPAPAPTPTPTPTTTSAPQEDVENDTIYVQGLGENITPERLLDFFKQTGAIKVCVDVYY